VGDDMEASAGRGIDDRHDVRIIERRTPAIQRKATRRDAAWSKAMPGDVTQPKLACITE
jgi:hypothetical protein